MICLNLASVRAGLRDHTATPFARLIIALAAIHAVPATEIRTARTADLNLARGTLELRRGLLRHTLYLEELTHRLTTGWLTYHHRRWPASANPHLLVSQKTALDPDHPAVHRNTCNKSCPRACPRQAVPGPHPRRSLRHRRPSQAHEALRHHRTDRHALRRHRLSGANRATAQVTGPP
ncbi:hypothetical protein SGFS_002050 [Streptomyces graminofaciens]|uniref:Transposase n=1 Tax=Streptomyces graminofaciens TaxID=68212 RepID=A0ABM7EZR2_9ACTN|nr:hypothetical protein SGFS_002050 [Streptomyces graminofaciens]